MSLVVDVHLQAGLPGEGGDPFAHSRLRRTLESRTFRFGASDRPAPRSIAEMVERMDVVGVDVICLMSGDYNRAVPDATGSYEEPNDYLARLVAESPRRIVGTPSVDPITDPPVAVREIERCVRVHGFTAVKLYPVAQQWDPRDERLYAVYRRCIDLDLTVHMHMGWTPVVGAALEFQRPWLLDEVGRRFPELRLVVSHLGYPYVEECAGLLARHENFHGDISLWGLFHPSKILRMLIDVGSLCSFDKLLYGSTNPLFDTYPAVLRSLNGIADRDGLPAIPAAAMRRLMGENACRLWKIDEAKMGRAPSRP